MPTKVPNRKKKPGVLGTTTNGSAGNFTDSAMDEFLAKRGLYRKPIAKDGSCLFRAVSEQVHNCQARHLDVRNQCIAFMRQNSGLFEEFVEGPFDHHLFKLQNPKEWAGQVEITALSQMYRKDFVVYQDINSSPTKVTDHGYKEKIILCYSNGNHYDIIYHSQFQENAAMCQTLLFEMLYNKVFIELDKNENAKKGKQKVPVNVDNSRTNEKGIMEWVNGCMTDDVDTAEISGDDNGWTEVKSKTRAKHGRQVKPVEVDENKEPEETQPKVNNDQKYLWEVRRSVDPHLYRNISLEVWEEDKHVRQQQDLAVAVTLQYKNSDRCLVKLSPPNAPIEKNYTAIIKEDYTGSGNILVYIPELKEKQVVPIQCVKPSENQHGHGYKELSGYYKKEEATNGPVSEDGSKDDAKNKKKRPPRNRRVPGKGADDSGNVSEDAPRGRGRPRDKYGNRRRFPKDNRNVKDEEEARFIAEQIKLVELQEKDPKAFPALPVRSTPQVSPSAPADDLPPIVDVEEEIMVPPPTVEMEENPQEKEKAPTCIESTPAAFWSRLIKTKQGNETANQPAPPTTIPSTRKPEDQPQSPTTIPSTRKPEEQPHSPTIVPSTGKPEDQPHSPTTVPMTRKSENRPQQSLEAFPNKEEDRTEIQEHQECTFMEAVPTQDKMALVDDTESTTKVKNNDAPEIGSRQYRTAQLKPMPSDVKHSKTSGQVFEVKISQPAKEMQQVKISPASKLAQQPKHRPQPAETREMEANAPSSPEASPDKVTDQEFTEQAMENKLVENESEMIDSSMKEQEPLHHEEEQPCETALSGDKPLITEEMCSNMEEYDTKEDEAKVNKSKLTDAGVSSATHERKTVTFAEKHKEIPDAPPYGQKGILIVNGTNRPNQPAEQGYKSPNTEDYTPVTKDAKQDFPSIPQEQTEKDLQSFPTAIANEGVQSSSPTAQQQNQALMQFMMPMFHMPAGVQIPTGPSVDPTGVDLPQDPLTLRYFFNLGYQQYLMMASQMNNQQFVYMYQGTMQEQMMQQSAQPVASLPQQPMYMHQQLAYQHAGMQNYQPPFHMPQTNPDSTSQHDRTSERTNPTPHQHQAQLQPQQQMQIPHKQQSAHFQPQPQQSQYSQSWRPPRIHYNSNKPHASHHGNVSQQRFAYHQNSGANPRQPHYKENKNQNQNRKQQGPKNRNNDSYSPHFNNMSHPGLGQNIVHNQVTPSQPTSFYMPPEQSKGPGHEYYPGNTVMYNTVNYRPQSGMSPHSTASRGLYN